MRASRRLRRAVRTSNVVSMEKLLVARPWNVDRRSGVSGQHGGRTPVTAGLGAFDQQIPLKLRDSVEDLHRHRTGRAGEIGTTRRETVDFHAYFREHLYGGADIDHVTVELGDNENVPRFQTVHEFGKATALCDGGAAGNRLGDDPARLDLEAGGFDFLNLVSVVWPVEETRT